MAWIDSSRIKSFKDILLEIERLEGKIFIEMIDFPFTPKPTKISVNWTSLSEQVLTANWNSSSEQLLNDTK